jgi:hypothetical protein
MPDIAFLFSNLLRILNMLLFFGLLPADYNFLFAHKASMVISIVVQHCLAGSLFKANIFKHLSFKYQ